MTSQLKLTTQFASKASAKTLLVGVGLLIMHVAPAHANALTYTTGANSKAAGASSASLATTFGEGKRQGQYSAQQFKLGYDYGLSDSLDIGLAANIYRLDYKNDPVPGEIEGQKQATRFSGGQVSLKKTLQPAKDEQLGVALYGMVKYDTVDNLSGHDVTAWEFEGKVILQQGFINNRLQWVNNLQFEGETAEANGQTDHALTARIRSGISYALDAHWSIGLEGFTDAEVLKPDNQAWEFDHWDVFAGPAIGYQTDNTRVAFTLMPQIMGSDERDSNKTGLHLADHEKLNARLVISQSF